MSKPDWYTLYKRKTVEDISYFDDERTVTDIENEFDIKLKEVENLFKGISGIKAEKYTYELLTGQKPDTTFMTEQTFQKNYTIQRLQGLADTYDEVKHMVRQYAKGRITLDYLEKFIEAFKETNIDYLLSYGTVF